MSILQIESLKTSQFIKDFLNKYNDYLSEKAPSETVPKIHVDEIASAIAKFYERVRNAVDYREEHLLRKSVITRTFKRRILMRGTNRQIAEPLIKELIRAGHLPNDTIPESKIPELQKIIDKYIFLFDKLDASKIPNRNKIFHWLLRLGACEIEEKIDPPAKDNMLAQLMFQVINDNLVIRGGQISDDIKKIQIFINTQHTLLRVDDDQLNYRLLKFLYPDWDNFSAANLALLTQKFHFLQNEIDKHINHPLGPLFFQLCNKYNTIFYLLGDAIYQKSNITDAAAIFDKTEQFDKAVKNAYQKRYEKERAKLARLSFFSILSFFLSKIVVALALEVPLDKYLTHTFSLFNIIISIVVPPLLMLLIVASIKMPSEKNFKLVVEEVQAAVFPEKNKKYLLKIAQKRPWPTEIFITLFYLITCVVSFGLISKLLLKLNFSVASIVVFLFFTSLVAVTGTKAYNRSQELSLEEAKGNILTFLIDMFSMPLVMVGKWAAYGLSKFNILVIALDLAIEVPLQTFLVFLENFRGFIKSKKDEIY